jgi:hypothetical protein
MIKTAAVLPITACCVLARAAVPHAGEGGIEHIKLDVLLAREGQQSLVSSGRFLSFNLRHSLGRSDVTTRARVGPEGEHVMDV